jgi:chromosome segregation ATPase
VPEEATMTVLDSIAKQANRLATDVQASLKRARVEGERRLLQRQHRAALEELGERAYELVRSGALPEEPLATEIGAVESKLMEIEAKVAEIDALRTEEEGDDATPAAAEDPSRTAFPMVDTPPPASGPGPGWEAAEKFFGDGPPPS